MTTQSIFAKNNFCSYLVLLHRGSTLLLHKNEKKKRTNNKDHDHLVFNVNIDELAMNDD